MTGVIQGGSEFVIAGYVLTWGVLSIYALSLFFRIRRCERSLKDGSS